MGLRSVSGSPCAPRSYSRCRATDLRAIEERDGLAMRRRSLRHPLFQGLVREPQAVGAQAVRFTQA
jgi:hypothetical protein